MKIIEKHGTLRDLWPPSRQSDQQIPCFSFIFHAPLNWKPKSAYAYKAICIEEAELIYKILKYHHDGIQMKQTWVISDFEFQKMAESKHATEMCYHVS